MIHLATAGFGYTRSACSTVVPSTSPYYEVVPTTHDWTQVDCEQCLEMINTANVVSRLMGRDAPFRTYQANGSTVITHEGVNAKGEHEQTWIIRKPGIVERILRKLGAICGL